MATVKDFWKWLERDLSRWGKTSDFVEITESSPHSCNIRIYTETNSYRIYVIDKGDHRPNGYLGCISNSRKPRAGEDWNRGNDLPDGPLTEETWHRILADIVSYELVKIHKQSSPQIPIQETQSSDQPEIA